MAYKRMGAILALLSMMLATGAHGFIFGSGDGALSGCAEDVFKGINAVRAASGAPAIEHHDALARMAQFKADQLAESRCEVYDNGGYLHYACHGENCNTCSNAASLWLSGVKFGGSADLDETRQGKDQFSYELLTSADTRAMGCATASGWSGSTPCAVTVCLTGSDIVKTVATAPGKPDVTFWLHKPSWVMPSNALPGDGTDECPDLAKRGLCGAGYQFSNEHWAGILSKVSVDGLCKGSCPAPVTPSPKPSRRPSSRPRRQPTPSSSRRMLNA